jgi:spore coat polysaccharide biosynthesis predicted glycosyltransferase SpsG
VSPAAPSAPLLHVIADGGPGVGYGHVGRCLAIAEALGWDAAFDVEDAGVQRFVRERGGSCDPAPEAPVVLLDHAGDTDAAEVLALQERGRRVVLLDDRGPARDVADLVVDPPTAASWPATPMRRLSGFEHVLLRGEVRDARRAERPHGVLLALGGSDPTQLTPVLARSLADVDGLVVNLGPGYAGPRPDHGDVLGGPHEFVGALSRVALIVAAYGHSLLEAAHLGTPALVVVTRPDHRDHAEAFVQNGTAEIVAAGEVAPRVHALLSDPDRLAQMTARGHALVDGGGAARVAAAIRALVA